jgi:hypothetical protein
MFRRAARRLRTAFLVVLSLLFAQLALATYVCPAGSPAAAGPAVMRMASGEPCEGMASDEARPLLCHQHCANAPQSPDAVKLPAVSLPAVVQLLVLPPASAASGRQAGPAAKGEPPPPPEPVFLSTLRLRV